MKKILFSLFLVGFGLATSAQTLKEELQYIQDMWGKEKKTMVNEVLKLTGTEAEKFWPLFDAYQVERQKYGQQRMQAIKMYADNYETMTNEKATEIAKLVLKNNESLDKLQSQYFKKVSKAVSPIRAVQFLQFESFIDAQIKAELTDALPFFPDPKK